MSLESQAPSIAHDEAAHRFAAVVDGHRCLLDYALADGVMTIVHTYVPPPLEGRGLAAALTRSALGVARARGWRVRAQCSYAVAYLRKHPEAAG